MVKILFMELVPYILLGVKIYKGHYERSIVIIEGSSLTTSSINLPEIRLLSRLLSFGILIGFSCEYKGIVI